MNRARVWSRWLAASVLGSFLVLACQTPTPSSADEGQEQQGVKASGCTYVHAYLTGLFLRADTWIFVDLTRVVGPHGTPLPLKQQLYFGTPVKITLVGTATPDPPPPNTPLASMACRVDFLFMPQKISPAGSLEIKETGELHVISSGSQIVEIQEDWLLYMDVHGMASSARRGTGTGTVGIYAPNDSQAALVSSEAQGVDTAMLAIYGFEANGTDPNRKLTVKTWINSAPNPQEEVIESHEYYRTVTRQGSANWTIGAETPCSNTTDRAYRIINELAAQAGMRTMTCNQPTGP